MSSVSDAHLVLEVLQVEHISTLLNTDVVIEVLFEDACWNSENEENE